jgi:predicted GIY-YIG superfamily endonuclease
MSAPIRIEHDEADEPEQVIVHVNGISVYVIANTDGSVYVEACAELSTQQAVVQHAALDRYTVRCPSLRLEAVSRPKRKA